MFPSSGESVCLEDIINTLSPWKQSLWDALALGISFHHKIQFPSRRYIGLVNFHNCLKCMLGKSFNINFYKLMCLGLSDTMKKKKKKKDFFRGIKDFVVTACLYTLQVRIA